MVGEVPRRSALWSAQVSAGWPFGRGRSAQFGAVRHRSAHFSWNLSKLLLIESCHKTYFENSTKSAKVRCLQPFHANMNVQVGFIHLVVLKNHPIFNHLNDHWEFYHSCTQKLPYKEGLYPTHFFDIINFFTLRPGFDKYDF